MGKQEQQNCIRTKNGATFHRHTIPSKTCPLVHVLGDMVYLYNCILATSEILHMQVAVISFPKLIKKSLLNVHCASENREATKHNMSAVIRDFNYLHTNWSKIITKSFERKIIFSTNSFTARDRVFVREHSFFSAGSYFNLADFQKTFLIQCIIQWPKVT